MSSKKVSEGNKKLLTKFLQGIILFPKGTTATNPKRRKGGYAMPNKDKQILDTLVRVLPRLNDAQKERLLGFGDGVAVIAEQQTTPQDDPE